MVSTVVNLGSRGKPIWLGNLSRWCWKISSLPNVTALASMPCNARPDVLSSKSRAGAARHRTSTELCLRTGPGLGGGNKLHRARTARTLGHIAASVTLRHRRHTERRSATGKSKNLPTVVRQIYFCKNLRLLQQFGLGNLAIAATTRAAVAWGCWSKRPREPKCRRGTDSSTTCRAARHSRF